jgi:hypothetical protein
MANQGHRVNSVYMGAPFRDARLKIDRAKKHIADFEAAVITQKNTYTATIEHRPDTGVDRVLIPCYQSA